MVFSSNTSTYHCEESHTKHNCHQSYTIKLIFMAQMTPIGASHRCPTSGQVPQLISAQWERSCNCGVIQPDKPLRISVFLESNNDSERLNNQEHQPWYNQILMWNCVCFSRTCLTITAWHRATQTVSRLKSHPEIGRRASDRPEGEQKETITKVRSSIRTTAKPHEKCY